MAFSYETCSQIPQPLKPYGDIAGLGVGCCSSSAGMKMTNNLNHVTQVILAFVISAWLTILILVAYYIFAFNPYADPFSDDTNPTTTYFPNPLDVLLAKYTKCLRTRKNFQGGPAEKAFHEVSTHMCVINKHLSYLRIEVHSRPCRFTVDHRNINPHERLYFPKAWARAERVSLENGHISGLVFERNSPFSTLLLTRISRTASVATSMATHNDVDASCSSFCRFHTDGSF